MTELSLQTFLDGHPDPVRALRTLPYTSPITFPGLAQREYSNWRREQQAWHQSAALMDQSHHMIDLFVTGPDALALFRGLAVNSFEKFPVSTAKQFIATNAEGFMIGDGILIRLAEQRFQLIGDLPVTSWVRFHIESGDWDVDLVVDPSSPLREPGVPPVNYRYEIQGPDALKVIEQATGVPVPATKFFHLTEFEIGGHTVTALRHGMAGQPGYELFGPWAEGDDVREALLAAGADFDLEQVGFYAYFTANLESGWFYVPVPAIFSSDSTRAFREWFPYYFAGALIGSYDAENIEEYYVTPFDLGYGKFVAFDHEFVGRDALEAAAARPARRQKVTLIWDDEDLGNAVAALVRPEDGLPPQPIDFNDQTMSAVHAGGGVVGFAPQSAYLSPHRRYVSIAVVDTEFAAPGTEVTVIWGDSLALPRPDADEHRQLTIRATVAPSPFEQFAREVYRK